MGNLVIKRINLGNPLEDENVTFEVGLSRFPGKKSKKWGRFQLREIPSIRNKFCIKIPTISDQDCLKNMAMGTYR